MLRINLAYASHTVDVAFYPWLPGVQLWVAGCIVGICLAINELPKFGGVKIMKKILFAAVALVAASALPASSQTINWGGNYGGTSGAGSTVSGFSFGGGGSMAQGSAATTGWANGSGSVVGGAIVVPPFGASAGIGTGTFSAGSGGQTAAQSQSGTGFFGSSSGSAYGSTSGGSSGSVQLRP